MKITRREAMAAMVSSFAAALLARKSETLGEKSTTGACFNCGADIELRVGPHEPGFGSLITASCECGYRFSGSDGYAT